MRKLFSVALSVMLSLYASAYDFCNGGIYYNITSPDAKTVAVTSGDESYSGSVVIPDVVLYGAVAYRVTSIGESAFNGCSDLTSVIIPSTVTRIGNMAFCMCTGLTEINIPDGVADIEARAFAWCSNLSSVNLPAGLKRLGSSAFSNTNISSVTVPAGVAKIDGDQLFFGCNALSSIVVAEGNNVYDSRNGCNAIIETETNELVAGCANMVIPDDVTRIGEGACGGLSNITSLVIPAGVNFIGSGAFSGCRNIGDIYCQGSVPPGYSFDVFYYPVLSTCTVHVPYGSLQAYKASDWNDFMDIVEYDPTNVGVVETGMQSDTQIIYGLGGVRMTQPRKGVYIVNGRKVMY